MPGLLRGSSRAYYGAHAAAWDDLRRTYYSDDVVAEVLDRALPGRLLDVGCGPGFLLARALDDSRFPRVTGVDFSHSMLQLLRARLDPGPRLNLRLADARKLPFRDGTFDSVVSQMALHHLAEPWTGLREMARVTRPGGRVVLADLRAHAHEWFRDELADAWLGFEEDDVKGWMDDAGLRNVTLQAVGRLTTQVTNGSTHEAEVEAFVASGDKA